MKSLRVHFDLLPRLTWYRDHKSANNLTVYVGVDGNDDEESNGCLEWMRLERDKKKVLTTLIGEKVLYKE